MSNKKKLSAAKAKSVEKIPDFVPLIEPLRQRFPKSWEKATRPGDDGEFNARTVSVLRYEHGYERVGRNGKRGNPHDLSLDVINWKGTTEEPGQNPDPTRPGGTGTVIDYIVNHQRVDAFIDQNYTDPNGPGAWVAAQTLAQIDQQYGADEGGSVPTPQPPPAIPSYEAMGGDEGGKKVTRLMEADYKRAEKPGLDGDSGAWQWRTAYDFIGGKFKTVEESIAVHQPEWRQSLNDERASQGKPPIIW